MVGEKTALEGLEADVKDLVKMEKLSTPQVHYSCRHMCNMLGNCLKTLHSCMASVLAGERGSGWSR
jgi:hypothetical protein